MNFLIISGMSGAGKSRAVASMEDLGYYCVDNLPLALIPTFAEVCLNAAERYEHVALCTDVRAGGNFDQLFASLDAIKSMGCEVQILFLDTDTSTLINRFKETRRKHPLMENGLGMVQAIERERTLLEGIRGKADYVIDTTRLSAAGLRERIIDIFSSSDRGDLFEVTVESFGFKYGIPPESDLVFDVRFLPNPFYMDELKQKTGLDREVQDYVMSFPEAHTFVDKLTDMVDFLIPNYINEGKYQLVIAIGCTGGQHRSVTLAGELYKRLKDRGDYGLTLRHRDTK